MVCCGVWRYSWVLWCAVCGDIAGFCGVLCVCGDIAVFFPNFFIAF